MMKYFLLPALAILLGACGGSNSVQQINGEADTVLMDVFKSGDVDKLDKIVADDFVNHSREGQVGLDSLKLSIKGFHLNMKNLKMEVITKMANDDYVSNWVRFTGGNPTVLIEGIEVTRYYDGLAKEHWFFPGLQDNR
ncbi:nuclear transport factor 2 family protein [Maribacter arenosus]|uniref:Nuclear transport factor 2 family protein n=1 Tax=Maribacter arenosus TaxID=1854708 RepID=A0ABR7VDZ1_9FLAO|nr:nuclear transport factor 2 family protein [Maribacter arenosus]MBD0851842.1 nuclear transport factor 2 family protein [Maribacter arenosus]